MSLKREASPAPLATSKLSLGKLTGRQCPSGSISIRFSTASAEDGYRSDDDDLTISSAKVTGPGSGADKGNDRSPRDRSPKEMVTIDLISRNTQGTLPTSTATPIVPATVAEKSKSAPPSEVSTPVSPVNTAGSERAPLARAASDAAAVTTAAPTTQNPPEEEQRSLLAGFRERFQDRIPEPLSQLIDKFSGENSPEEKERRIRKSESLDSSRCGPGGSDLFGGDRAKKESRDKSHSRNASSDSSIFSPEQVPPSPASDKMDKSRGSSFELVEDFYGPEPFEDFSAGVAGTFQGSLPGARRSTSSDQISRVSCQNAKPKSKLQRLIGSIEKNSGGVGGSGSRSVSMTLSGLLHANKDELELSDDEFFDLEDHHRNSLPTPNPDGKEADSGASACPSIQNQQKVDSTSGANAPPPLHRLLAATAILFAYLVVPLPPFIDGLIIGAFAALAAVRFYRWWMAPAVPRGDFTLPDLTSITPLRIPDMVESKNEDGKFKGWMNELHQYNPEDYHINQTHSIYVQLEGSVLRLQRPKHNVPKRSMWDERPLPTPTFVHQRHFDLVGSCVSLVPPGLVRKRLWSKKYPICLALAKTGSKLAEPRLRKESSTESEYARGMGYEVVQEVCDDSVLFLFARTGREKEAWYRRLEAAARGDPLPTRLSDLVLPTTAAPRSGSSAMTTSGSVDTFAASLATDQLSALPHSERGGSDCEMGTDVVAKLQKRHSTPNLVRQPTPPLVSAPTQTSTSTAGPTSTTAAASSSSAAAAATAAMGVASAVGLRHRRQDSADSISSVHSEPLREGQLPPPPPSPSELLLTEYIYYMGGLLPSTSEDEEPSGRGASWASSPSTQLPPMNKLRSEKEKDLKKDKEKDAKKEKERDAKKDKDKDATSYIASSPRSTCDLSVLWLNALLGRCFWDFLREPYWAERMRERIQRKLSKIHVPYMIDELTVTDIDMGRETPFVRRVSRPYMDDQGLWMDVDMAYNGGFHMSLETKVNLMKLKKTVSPVGVMAPEDKSPVEKRSPVTDSEEEDSAESSTDEEADEPAQDSTEERPDGGRSTSRKLLRLVDKITQSKYFQQATEYKYIKRAMEGVSNTPLQLSVELRGLAGTLAINVPPPPTDRIWYGFRTNPKLWLLARPKVGQREVTVTHITDWIEKKLQIEFQRVFVMPNMDDLPVPLMSDHLDPAYHEPPS